LLIFWLIKIHTLYNWKNTKQFSTFRNSKISINYTGEQMPTKKELEKRRDKRKQEEAEKAPKPKEEEAAKKDTEIIKKQTESNKAKKHK